MKTSKTELATLANSVNKINKSRAHEIITDLATGLVHDDDQVILFASLYRYFMPPIPKKPKNAMQWVNVAVNGDEIRKHISNAYSSENGDYVGIDGQRMHLVKNQGKEIGYYDKACNKVEADLKFPDYNRLIPDKSKCTQYNLRDIDTKIIPNNTKEIEFKYVVDVYVNGVRISRFSKKYWDDALSIFSDNVNIWLSEKASLLIEENDNIAVIMPVKL